MACWIWNLNFMNIVIKCVIWGKLSTRAPFGGLAFSQATKGTDENFHRGGKGEGHQGASEPSPKKLPLGLHTGSLLQLKEGHLVFVLSPPWLLQEWPSLLAFSPPSASPGRNLCVPASSCSISAEQGEAGNPGFRLHIPLVSNIVKWKERGVKNSFSLFFFWPWEMLPSKSD